MKRVLVAVVAVLVVAAAVAAIVALRKEQPQAKPNAVEAVPPIVIAGPVNFTMSQRSSIPLPGSDGRIIITLDDITGGQVLTTVSWQDGGAIVATRSLRTDDGVTFKLDDHAFRITIVRLMNALVGEDYAELRLAPVAESAKGRLTEEETIESLIESIRKLGDGTFIRDGKEHTANEAVAHLRDKWNWKKSEIKTAEDFIEIAGTESSTSGEPYLIKLPDGTVVKSGDWFRGQLAELEAAQRGVPAEASRSRR